VHEKCKFLISVFQGNAATYLRCGGYPNIGFVGNLLLFAAVKNCENPPRIDKVIAMVRVATFFELRCTYIHSEPLKT